MKYIYNILLTALGLLLLSSNLQSQEWTGVTTKDTTALMNSATFVKNDLEMNVWIGYKYHSDDGHFIPKVAKWDGEKLYIYSAKDDLEFGVVRSVLPARSGGHIWFATATGLRRINADGTYEDFPLPQDEEGFRVIEDGQFDNMVEGANGEIYCSVNIYEQKDIYNNDDKTLSRDSKVWVLDNGMWKETSLMVTSRSLKQKMQSDASGNLYIGYYSIEPFNTGPKIFKYDSESEKESTLELEHFAENKIQIFPESFVIHDEKIIISYSPSEQGVLYEGFSIYDTRLEEWKHFGSNVYSQINPDLDFHPIPSASRESNGEIFPETNWANNITIDRIKGYWLGMLQDYKADWLETKGGGLIYFDGESTFIRYSSDTHTGIEPFRPNPKLSHYSDDLEPSQINWKYGSGVAYDKNGDLFVGSWTSGLWVISKDQLPAATSVEEEITLSTAVSIEPNILSSGNTFNVRLNIGTADNISAVTISDQTGKVVSLNKTDARIISIDTDGLSTGMYFVNIYYGKKITTKKLIVR